MDADRFISRISELTGLDREHAALTARATLVTLGTRIDPGEADDLAAQLPGSLAACLPHEGEAERFPPDEFKRRVARIVPLANDQAPGAIRAVFTVLSEAVSAGELRQVLGQLGNEYESLVGMPTGIRALAAT
jgi:uncharacterized protein (DUF2267 family)